MAEHVLRGELGVFPRMEGGRNLLINDTGEIYRIPLQPEVVTSLIETLGLTDEELEAEIEKMRAKQEAAASLIVPGGNGMGGAN